MCFLNNAFFEEWSRLISEFTDGTGRLGKHARGFTLPLYRHNSHGLVKDTSIYNPVTSYKDCLIPQAKKAQKSTSCAYCRKEMNKKMNDRAL